MNTLSKISFLLITAFMFSCNAWENELKMRNSNDDLYEACQTMPEISIFTSILQKTGYDKFLENEQSLTVFAPTNDALSSLNLSDTAMLKVWIKDYIAGGFYYTNANGSFDNDNVVMINNKNIPIGQTSISGANIIKNNIGCKNGVLHIIDNTIEARKSIWEYVNEQTGYQQVQFIVSEFQQVIDTLRSVQTGIDTKGRPVYDTVWVTRNAFLEKFPVNSEKQNFTFILLDNSALELLKTKYAKYFRQKDANVMAREIMRQLSGDLVLQHTKLTAAGRFPSTGNVLVDIDPAHITETYQASNGMVYKVSAADIKIYQNKIKEQIIDANDYVERYPVDPWLQRYRSWAMGGNDIVLKDITVFNHIYDRRLIAVNGSDSIVQVNQQSGQLTYDGDARSKTVNSYLKYEPTLYSTSYEIAWNAYDDVASHTNAMRIDLGFDKNSVRKYDTIPMALHQKLMLSFPSESVVRRTADGYIAYNFSSFTCMGGIDSAGVNTETTLKRYRKIVAETEATSNFVIGIPATLWTESDNFGQGSRLDCPTYGKATFLVTNTFVRTSYAGMVFLNYIKIKPIVDPND